MKAMVLTGIRKMEARDVSRPTIRSATDVLVRMKAIGVCGSDVHYYLRGRIGSQVVKYPFVVGHEGAGVVEEVGSSVRRVGPGDLVAVDPAMPCWSCDQCRAGRHHTCRKLRFLGCPGQSEGCLSEYLVMPETSCFRLPDGMTAEDAALSEPLAIGVYGVRLSIPMEGARIGILGAGPIGLSVLVPAKAQGAHRIYVTDRIDARIAVARGAGATWAGNPDREDIVAAILEREPGGLDAVFDCCGKQEALDQAVRLLRPGGKLMVIGIPETDRVSFDVDDLRRKEISIQNVRRQVDCVEEALEGLRTRRYDVRFFVTHRFPLERAGEAFDLVADYRDGVVKAMIEV